MLFFKLVADGSYVYSVVSFFAFLGMKYYSRIMYPFLAEFEAYYVEKILIGETMDRVRIIWI